MVEWKGGQIPTLGLVNYRTRDGGEERGQLARYLRWTHIGAPDDITSYEVVVKGDRPEDRAAARIALDTLEDPVEVKTFGPLPVDAKARKSIPVYSGFVNYFPDAMAAVAELSRVGNDQHNPGKPLFWDRSKSGDERDALMRHLLEAGTVDADGVRHSTKVAWRAMANLRKEIEDSRAV